MSVLTFTWVIHVSESKHNIRSIFVEQKQSRLLMTMRDAARQRTIYLHRMAMMEDEFDRDEEYMRFKQAAADFIKARDELLSLEKDATEEILIWNRASPNIRKGQAVQQEVLELIMADKTSEANQLLLDKVIPIQDNINSILSAMFAVQEKIAEAEYYSVYTRNHKIHWIASLAGSGAVILTIIIAFVVTRRAMYAEASLLEARTVAQMATELKSQFLANMSHEIRTPLTAVIGYADTLLEHDLEEEEREHSVIRILHNGKHLLRIINDILDISKIEAGQLSIEKIVVSPVALMRDIDSLIGESIREKGLVFNINYHFPLPSEIVTDPTRLKQILLNLIGNAKKFTTQGSVDVDIAFLSSRNQLRYVISDSGLGMCEQQQSRLFKPFSQADASTTRKYGGTGLGLYISRQLAKMLGGDLICESQEGKGSRFIVSIATGSLSSGELNEIPLMEVRETLMESNKSVFVIPSLRGTVLLAEDLADNQRLISRYIKSTGASVVVVDNGQLAVEQALANEFDLILMDMQMPVMGGGEAVQWLRRVGNMSPIAMLTANAMKEEKDHCMKLGVNDFLTKPIDKRSFFIVLAKYLKCNDQSATQAPVGFDEELAELVAQFIASLPDSLEELGRALDADDWDQVKAVVHRLKGLGGGFGFPKITDQCADVEVHIRGGDRAAAAAQLGELFSYIDQILKAHADDKANAVEGEGLNHAKA